MQVVSTQEAKPPYILANFPKAEVQFMCLDQADRELGRPKLRQAPDTLVEVKGESRVISSPAANKDVYAELLKLDELRKRGLLSDLEFETQKKRLLAE